MLCHFYSDRERGTYLIRQVVTPFARLFGAARGRRKYGAVSAAGSTECADDLDIRLCSPLQSDTGRSIAEGPHADSPSLMASELLESCFGRTS